MTNLNAGWRIKVRNFKWDDLYAVQALINTVAEDDGDPLFYNLEWLYYVLNQEDVGAERSCFVATVYAGRIVGYSCIEASDTPNQRRVFAGTHPRFCGIGVGRALITTNDFNLQSIHPPTTPLTIIRHSTTQNTVAQHLLTLNGYQQVDTDEHGKLIWQKSIR